MPVVIADNEGRSSVYFRLGDVSYDYDYPEGLDLRPGSRLHSKIVLEVTNRARDSYNVMQARHAAWKAIDETTTAYITTDTKEQLLKASDARKPVSIVVPQTYATLEILLTYMTAALLSDPTVWYEGVGPEDTLGAILLSKVIQHQGYYTKMQMNLHTMFRDGFCYGLSAVSPVWTVERGWVSRAIPGIPSPIDVTLGRTPRQQRVSMEELLFEGNKVENIDPYAFLPDPNVSIEHVQDGEFCGWIAKDSVIALMKEEKVNDLYFNTRYLQHLGDCRSAILKNESSGRATRSGISTQQSSYVTSGTTKRCDVIWMYIDLIPKEWKLSKEEYPETWLFAVAADQIVIMAQPLNLNHNKKPIVTFAPDFTGYDIAPISRMETINGLQVALDWMFNCYDDQTEILTNRGWRLFADCVPSDEVATVHPETREIWFEQPKEWFEYAYSGRMINFKSSRMDICVTPNHNIFGRHRNKALWHFTTAGMLCAFRDSLEFKTLGNVRWEGTVPEDLVLLGEQPVRQRGVEQRYQDVVIDKGVLAGFLGWFVSEGSITHGKASGSYTIAIKQKKTEYHNDIDGIMSCMPFNVTRTFDAASGAIQWTICDKRFYAWLAEHCYTSTEHSAATKKLPDCVREWDFFHLQLLFDRAMWGDGSWMKGHENLGKIGSISRRLIDDLHEVVIKLGYFGHTREGKTPAGKPFYILQLSTASTYPTIAARNCLEFSYIGKVYCVENSTHLVVTRRNGKVAIQGQSHVANVRKSINDMLVVDPSLVNMDDLKDPQPGKLIRLRRSVWGRGVDSAVKQLAVTDITRNNVADASIIMDLMKATSGSVDAVSGLRRKTSERVTAEEVRGDRFGGLSRLERLAKVAGWMALQDLGMMLASQTQQLMSEETYIKTAGQWQDVLLQEYGITDQRYPVTPFDILVNYDVYVRDGAVPGGNFADVWTQMLPQIMQDPEVRQRMDILRVIKHIMRSLGAKDVNQFDRRQPLQMPQMNVQTMPDEQVMQQAQAGNVVPVGGE